MNCVKITHLLEGLHETGEVGRLTGALPHGDPAAPEAELVAHRHELLLLQRHVEGVVDEGVLVLVLEQQRVGVPQVLAQREHAHRSRRRHLPEEGAQGDEGARRLARAGASRTERARVKNTTVEERTESEFKQRE